MNLYKNENKWPWKLFINEEYCDIATYLGYKYVYNTLVEGEMALVYIEREVNCRNSKQ